MKFNRNKQVNLSITSLIVFIPVIRYFSFNDEISLVNKVTNVALKSKF